MTKPARPVRPAILHVSTGLLLAGVLVWVVALVWPDVTAPLLLIVVAAYAALILLAWAGRDTRGWIFPMIWLLYCVVPAVAAITNPADLARRGILILSALLLALFAALPGYLLLFRPDANAYIAQSKAFRMAAKQAGRRR